MLMELSMPKFPLNPKNPERICWGCEKLCPANDMRCGNGCDRAQHPVELFGQDWSELEEIAESTTHLSGSEGAYCSHSPNRR